MIPEVDKLEKYKYYLHGGFIAIIFCVAVITFYEDDLGIFSYQIFLVRMLATGIGVIIYVIALKGFNMAIRYLLK